MLQDLTVTEFLERVSFMPPEEAERELSLRREQSALEMAMLHTELHRLTECGQRKSRAAKEVGAAISVVCADNSRLASVHKAVNLQLDKISWRKAVRAVFGEEGYDQCRIWMAANSPMKNADVEGDIDYYRKKGVIP